MSPDFWFTVGLVAFIVGLPSVLLAMAMLVAAGRADRDLERVRLVELGGERWMEPMARRERAGRN